MKYMMFFLPFSFNACFGQADTLHLDFLRNDSIRFEFVRISIYPTAAQRKKLAKAHNVPQSYVIPSRFVRVGLELDKKTVDFLLQQSPDFWMIRLKDTTSDWASNLTLYNIHARDAEMLANVFNTRQLWMKIKNGEIAAWKEILYSKKHRTPFD